MNEYPKKTCEIERLVTIPEDVARVLNCQKTATRRNGVYAHPGEIMTLEGQEFVIDALYSQELGEMTDADALREGFESLEAYKESILSIHPNMPWLPTMKVWVHEFSPVKK
ncbi:fructose-1-phosphate kinase [Sporosarcina sp. HYO08]|uniref:fructose-1-phosphate kinase n=1 Tax=Sporosarcina sp. HYO08 TaxID=1759557 RepID=UPI000796F6AB|nr:fructose-1-phosphate kinase [Sporosarcina sp. HYO08]KXH87105.1 fructose-1-phosphate kinase [Sporosarcina sp. HYO08]